MPSLCFGFTLLLFLEFVDIEGDNLVIFLVLNVTFSSISSFILNGTKLDVFYLRSGTMQGHYVTTTS